MSIILIDLHWERNGKGCKSSSEPHLSHKLTEATTALFCLNDMPEIQNIPTHWIFSFNLLTNFSSGTFCIITNGKFFFVCFCFFLPKAVTQLNEAYWIESLLGFRINKCISCWKALCVHFTRGYIIKLVCYSYKM